MKCENLFVAALGFLATVALMIANTQAASAYDLLPYAVDKIDKNGNYILKGGELHIGDEISTYNEYPVLLSRRKLPRGTNGGLVVSFENIEPYMMKIRGATVFLNLSETSKASFFVYSCSKNGMFSFEIQEGEKYLLSDRKTMTKEGFNKVFKNYSNGFAEISYPSGSLGSHTHLIEIHNDRDVDELVVGAFYFDFMQSAIQSAGKQIIDSMFGDNIKPIKKMYEEIEKKIDKNEFKKIVKKSNDSFDKICLSAGDSYATKMLCDGARDYLVSYNIAKLSAPYMCGR